MDRATLHGLKAIKVVVDPPASEIEREGLDREHLRMSIEQKLRDAGIKIDSGVTEFVGLSVALTASAGRKSALSIRKIPSSLTISLGVYQVVMLSRDQTTKTVAETWGDQRIMLASSRDFDRVVSSAVDELVDQFVKAYRSVNP